MPIGARRLGVVVLLTLACGPVQAASLQVQPALIDVTAPGASSTITLRNPSRAPINVQVRVFKWSQTDGKEVLEATTDVVASPPSVTLAPNVDYVARVVRVRKDAIEGEEAYRLLVDELPDATAAPVNTIRLLVRHSIPVFFSAQGRSAAQVEWFVSRQGEQVALTARNAGSSRLRLSEVSLRDRTGNEITFGKGLLGYALGRSTMRWTAPGRGSRFNAGAPVAVTARGNDGPINATASGSAR